MRSILRGPGQIQLYSTGALVYPILTMNKTTVRALLTLAFACSFLTGCTYTSITNLTPSRYPRNADGLYPFQVEWASNQQSLQRDSLKPSVIIGMETYPLQPTPMLKNRWEALVPVPADKAVVNYRYKFDYDYLGVPARRPNSKLSAPYQLQIQEK